MKMFHNIKYPGSFWLLIVYLILTATVVYPHLWSVPVMFLIALTGWAIRAVAHHEGRGTPWLPWHRRARR